MKFRWTLMAGVASLQTLPLAASAQEKAPPAIDLGASYIIDAIGVMSADQPDHADLLDNLDLIATLDLDRPIGWSGGTGHLHLLNNFGGNPNNYAGTLQGIDNIEVAGQRLRLFEAWIDLNSEFYTNESAGLLIAPAFGVGSEIAATGPNGPSLFPSTALSIRIDHHIGDSGYIRFAALNASAGTLDDTQGGQPDV